MTQSELKRKLADLVREYFGGAAISWGKVKAVNPHVPQIVLNMGAVTRPYQPIKQKVGGVIVHAYPSRTTLQVDLYTKGAATNTDPGVTAAYENTAVNDLTDFLNFINSEYVDDWGDLHDISIQCHQVTDLTELINDVSWEYRAMTELEIGFTQNAVGHTGTMYESGAQHYDNGRPMRDPETGMPLYDNGRPMYDADGNPLDPDGNIITDGVSPPSPPPEFDGDGNPILPAVTQTPSGGRTQALAGETTGWFEQVDGPEFVKEEDHSNV